MWGLDLCVSGLPDAVPRITYAVPHAPIGGGGGVEEHWRLWCSGGSSSPGKMGGGRSWTTKEAHRSDKSSTPGEELQQGPT